MYDMLLYASAACLLAAGAAMLFGRRRIACGPLPAAPREEGEIARRAREAAETHAIGREGRDRERALRLRTLYREMAYGPDPAPGEDLPEDAVCFADNRAFFVRKLRETARECRETAGIPLPRLRENGRCRVAEAAMGCVEALGGRLDGESLAAYWTAYTRHQPLREEELQALPACLRLTVLEHILCEGRALARAARDRAAAAAIAARAPMARQSLENLLASAPASPAFWAHLAERFSRGAGRELLGQLDDCMRRRGMDPQGVRSLEYRRRSDRHAVVRHLNDSLRAMDRIPWDRFLESLSAVDACLRRDPAGVYPQMDSPSRAQYRAWLSRRARECRVEPLWLAGRILDAAGRAGAADRFRHVGAYLEPAGRNALRGMLGLPSVRTRESMLAAYLLAARILALLLTALAAWWVRGTGALPYLALLTTVPFFVLSQGLVQRFLMGRYPPSVTPRLELPHGIPPEGRTLVVIAALLTDPEEGRQLLRALEDIHLSQREDAAHYLLLADFAGSGAAVMPGDRDIVRAAGEAVDELTAVYGPGRFGVLFRSRRLHGRSGMFMGRERKRGALEDLMRWLDAGERGDFFTPEETLFRPEGLRYVMTLDADTRILPGSLRRYVGAMLHPLHTPEVTGGRVIRGYGVLAPRMEISLEAERSSAFAALFGGRGGLDAYPGTASSFWQDVFGRGIFAGKGILDMEAYGKVLTGRLPGECILSHDLLEGSFLRACNAGDLPAVDGFPSSYASWAAREHRWIRGDWQLLPFLGKKIPTPDGGKRTSPLPFLCRWQMADNLLRSAAPVFLVAYAVCAACLGRWDAGIAAAVLCCLTEEILSALGCLMRPGGRSRRWSLRSRGRGMLRAGAAFLFLPYTAWNSLDAIVRTLYRLASGRGDLLEWTTAAQSEGGRTRTAAQYARRMAPGILPLVPMAVACGAGAWGLAPFLALWACAPWAAARMSRPPASREEELTEEDTRLLRGIARRTYGYFARFAVEEENFLPPDNVQNRPFKGAAPRTSPTNMGYTLLAWCAGRQLGCDTAAGMLTRMERTLDAMDRLERWEGHFLNWYDTRSCAPLPPRYVSTVDSGNLMAALLGAGRWTEEMTEMPPVGAALCRGLADGLRHVLRRHTHAEGIRILQLLERDIRGVALARAAEELRRFLRERRDRPSVRLLEEVRRVLDDHRTLLELAAALWEGGAAEEADRLLQMSLRELAEDTGRILPPYASAETVCLAEDVRAWAAELCRRSAAVAARTDAMARAMDFRPLYDGTRRLFHIGRDLDRGENTPAHYDLMASEARCASYLAVATGQVPAEHWERLGRSLVRTARGEVLCSWSGTMFEYLMPAQFLPHGEGSLLGTSVRRAVAVQADRGAGDAPWGVSESGYHAFDRELSYQYRAFGLPELAVSPGRGHDRVLAPYAAAMALPYAPRAAMESLRRFMAWEMLGEYGFLEALDMAPSRLREGETHRRVDSYMVHHQGMALMAMTAVLEGDPLKRAMLAVPDIRAHRLLLEERMPVPGLAEAEALADERPAPGGTPRDMRVLEGDEGLWPPAVQLLGDGDMHLVIAASGASCTALGAWTAERGAWDAVTQDTGIAVTWTDSADGRVYGAARLGEGEQPEEYTVRFLPHSAAFTRRDGALETGMEVWVSPEESMQVRLLTAVNRGSAARELLLTVYFPLALDEPAAYAAHPGYRNLFLETDWDGAAQVLTARRRPRREGEVTPSMACRILTREGRADVRIDTDRARILGRTGEKPGSGDIPLSVRAHAVGEPAVWMQTTVTVPPGERRELAFLLAMDTDPGEAARRAAECTWSRATVHIPEMAFLRRQGDLCHRGISGDDLRLCHALSPYLVFSSLRAVSCRVGIAPRADLYPAGVGADRPIILLRADGEADTARIGQLIRCHRFLWDAGAASDLVILDDAPAGYGESPARRAADFLPAGGEGVHLCAGLSSACRRALEVWAVCVLDAGESFMPRLLPAGNVPPAPAARPAPSRKTLPMPDMPRVEYNGWGGFSPDGMRYGIDTHPGRPTPVPWSLVLTGQDFGAVVTGSGGGMTWQGNSQSHRLTPWSGDPVLDPPGSCIYLRDEETGDYWTVTPAPAGIGTGRTVFGPGLAVYRSGAMGLQQTQETWVHPTLPLRFDHLTVINDGNAARRLSVTAYARWILGSTPDRGQSVTETGTAMAGSAVWVRREAGGYAFLAMPDADCTASCDRGAFLGCMGSLAHPAGMEEEHLAEGGAAGGECGILRTLVTVPARARVSCTVILGWAEDIPAAEAMLSHWISRRRVLTLRREVTEAAEREANILTVETGDPALDRTVNIWAPYQTDASRFRGRAGFYQCGGAIGFRDQLQDCLVLLYRHPDRVREHILLCCAHQFRAGDVQHWWHEPRLGVRTHIRDDLLFLPFVTARYVEHTGDMSVLREEVPFLEDVPIPPGKEDVFASPAVSGERGSVLEHCIRAISRAAEHTGRHGLPLMGTGDWNDAMNAVGSGGRGESVWLGFFLCRVLREMIPLLHRAGRGDLAAEYAAMAGDYAGALDSWGWDGEWYRRACTDGGLPLGSGTSPECRIDCLSQAWAAIAHVTDPVRIARAMAAVEEQLLREEPEPGMLLLLDPPFARTVPSPGYIQGYLPGVRENGGQYTHAALWAVWAWAELGESDRAADLLARLIPSRHADTPEKAAVYRAEPYVLAADVYAHPACPGRGGWTWYTGSAAWLPVVVIRELLGLRFCGDRLEFLPRLPRAWDGARVTWRRGDALYRITLRRGEAFRVILDGETLPGRSIPLSREAGEHTVEVTVGV